MNNKELSEQEQIRRNSLEEIRNMEIDPYPAKMFPINTFSDIVENKLNTRKELYQKLKKKGEENIIKILNNRTQTLLEKKFKKKDINKVNKIIETLIKIIYFDDIITSKNTLNFIEIINRIKEFSNYDTNKIFKSLLEHLENKKDQELISLIKSRTYHSLKYFEEVTIAGRIMSRRIMGEASFAEIQDSKGKIQIYVRKDEICSDQNENYYNEFFKKLLDIGDIIGVKGYVFKTKMGETTIYVKKLILLSKSLRPLPIVKEKDGKTYDAFTDPEQRYRNRSMDMIVNPDVRKTFIQRTKLVNSMREFLNGKEYLEVETPILQPIYGGAAARPFKTHHNALNQTLYLRIANELYLKRLIVGGFDGVYEFSKDFRNEGMDRFHNPEFTQMEIYVTYKDYFWMMKMFEEMIKKVAMDLHGSTEVQVGENIIDFKTPWTRLTMFEAIEKFARVDISEMGEKELFQTAKNLGVEVDDSMGKGKLIDEIFGKKAEPKLIQPTFITDYPVEMSPLSKKHRSKEGLVERFEGIVNGKELCNAFSELNDPIDQRERFEEQLKLGKRGDEEAMILDEAFLKAIDLGMPPTAGLGVGIDRLAMMMTNSHSIQDVLFFPQMRPLPPDPIEEIDPDEDYIKIGVPNIWIEHLKKLGYIKIEKLKKVEKHTVLHQELCGYNKKNKLGLSNPNVEEVQEWLKKAKEGTKKEFNTQKREHNEGWIIKQIEELLEFANEQQNSSLVLYAALEARNLIEMVEYTIIKCGTPKNQWDNLEKDAKGIYGIQKSDGYKTLRKKHQLFYQFVANSLDVESYAFDLNTAVNLKKELASYIHNFTVNDKEFNYDGSYVQNGIGFIKKILNTLDEFFNKNDNEGTYGNIIFDTLPEEYREVFTKWKLNNSDDLEELEKLFNKK